MDEELKRKLNTLSPEQLKALMNKVGKTKAELPQMPRNAQNKYPLTSAQKRMWFLSKIDPNSFLYTNPMALRLKTKAPVEMDIYTQSFKLYTQRYEIMRTSFSSEDGHVFQTIHPEVPVDIKKIDLRAFSAIEQQEMIEDILGKDGQTAIDIEAFPLFRHSILQLSDLEYIFIYTSHHIISDAWSSSKLFRQVLHTYDDIKNETPLNLPPVKYQFIDYVNWECNWLKSPEYFKTLNTWKQLLPNDPEPLNLPFDFVRPPAINYEGALEKYTLKADLVKKLTDFSKHENVNLFHTLLSVFNILLHKYSGNEDIVVGIPFANRNIKEFQENLGLFLNTLPHKTTVDTKATFRQYLAQVKEISQTVFFNQELPFEKLIEEVKPVRSMAFSPIFQVLFVYQNIPSLYEWKEMKLSPEKADYKISKYALNLWLEDVGEEMFLSLTYQTSLFKKPTIKRLLNHFEWLLNQAVENPDCVIANLSVEAPKREAPINFLAVKGNYVQEFEQQVDVNPQSIAVKYLDTQLTYSELNIAANQIANHILQSKKDSGEVVMMMLDRSEKQLNTILGINKAGLAYLPVDPVTPQERLDFILIDAKVSYVITESKYQNSFAKSGVKVLLLDNDAELQQCSVGNPRIIIKPADLVYMIYTSGSTGTPKGVCIEHGNLFNYAEGVWERMGLAAGSKFATVSSITTDLGNTQIFPALMNGSSVHLIADDYVTDPLLLGRYMDINQVDCLKIVPSLLSSLLATDTSSHSLLPKKLLILGGEKVPASLVLKIRSLAPDLRIINHYGPTETTIGVLTHEIGTVNDNDIIPLGLPINNNRVFIGDKVGNEVPDGMMGEIMITGLNVGRGYCNRREQTESVFGIDQHSGNRTYRTGDAGRKLNDGTIAYLGRLDRQIKIRGYRVEPGEIEQAILKTGFATQAVVLSQTKNSLSAFIVAQSGNTDTQLLKKQLALTLPNHFVPANIFLLPELPRLGNGKVNTQLLMDMIPVHSTTSGSQPVSPRDEVELAIAHVWKNVLKTGSVSINDNFFDAGGNSLVAIEMIGKINSRFGLNLSISVMFEYNSISLLARLIRNKGVNASGNPLVMLQKGTGDKYLFIAHPAGGNVFSYYELALCIDKEVTIYGLQSAFSKHPDVSIHEMAARYLDAVRSEVPGGDYVFSGWSMGALIAYEMAVKAKAEENREYRVVLLDQTAPQVDEQVQSQSIDPVDRLLVFISKVEHLVGGEIHITREMLENASADERLGLFLAEFKRNNMVPEDTQLKDFHGFLEKMIAHNEITMAYRASRYDGPVLLIKAADSVFSGTAHLNDLAYGWGNYAEELEVVTVPGNHVTIVKQPYLQAVAACINKQIIKYTQTADALKVLA